MMSTFIGGVASSPTACIRRCSASSGAGLFPAVAYFVRTFCQRRGGSDLSVVVAFFAYGSDVAAFPTLVAFYIFETTVFLIVVTLSIRSIFTLNNIH